MSVCIYVGYAMVHRHWFTTAESISWISGANRERQRIIAGMSRRTNRAPEDAGGICAERWDHGKAPARLVLSFFVSCDLWFFEPRFQKIIILFASLLPLRLCVESEASDPSENAKTQRRYGAKNNNAPKTMAANAVERIERASG